ncbi:MAG: FkbM family methyltransferase [Caulobacterales bacterium]|nr:FkbM family methyltransferase [Caulobacterales bacterium]
MAAAPSPDPDAPTPGPLLAAIIAFTRAQPAGGAGKLLAKAGVRLGRALAPPTLDASLLGFRARLHPRDNLSEKRALFTPQLLEARELAFLETRIGEGFVFIDIGANFGLYTCFVAARAPASGRILAVEPQPEMRARLTANLALNRFAAPVEVADCAVSDRDGEAVLRIDTHNRGETRLASDQDDGRAGGAVTVPVRTLLSLMDAHGLARADAVKIDVEGHEGPILRAFLAEAPPERLPGTLLLETLHAGGEDPVALARAAGYEVALEAGRNVALTRAA